ncbi:hypothetical protein Ato02nite_100290 [Paractinoplanes toevensis]|uniref:Uncharacterized protein n=1 Tax=Paractinoplanes toevensis TaxID=571911 RepID=A0A920BS39_9ACTN|nr:hypothetical protein Ato02nite_100290 [Actinoplanes toevensis]
MHNPLASANPSPVLSEMANDLDGMLNELVRLLVDDKIPPTAFVYQWPGTVA